MELEELTQLVVDAHIHWNTSLSTTPNIRKQVISVWKSALHDVSHVVATRAIRELSLSETFMPRPSVIRKRALIISGVVVAPPESAAAWAEVQHLGRSVSSGTIQPAQVHVCVLKAIHVMGGISTIAFTTNGDRTQFIEVYKNVVTEWESQAYAFVD